MKPKSNNIAASTAVNGRGTVPDQVKLPASVALGVVTQGLRIRLGRSAITLTGIVCGIAFLMSITTSQLIKKGVSSEDAIREEANRIQSFVRADLPPLKDKQVQIIGNGTLSETETRVAESLISYFDADLAIGGKGSPTPTREIKGAKPTPHESPEIVFVMGNGTVPDFDWNSFLSSSSSAMAASTISGMALPGDIPEESTGRFITLSRKISAEEQERKEADAKKESFRSRWIVTISILVTIIGITNAMLMSVTERFREIGTMKCLGALSSFVTRIFVIEASILGFVGGLLGVLTGFAFSLVAYSFIYGAGLVLSSIPIGALLLYGIGGLAAGVILSIISAIYPAHIAASMLPATALRSTV